MSRLNPGDTLILLDGTYRQTLDITRSGNAQNYITIRALNVGRAFIDGEGSRVPVRTYNKSYVHIDGLRAGRSSGAVYSLLYAHNWKITRCSGFNAGGANTDTANFHVFEIAYSVNVFSEELWGWGTGRYTFIYYGCSNSTIRRSVFRPGFYRRCPHSGVAIYCTDNSLVENVIVFEARVDPASQYGGTAPWQLITGGFVSEGHDCPNGKSSANNRHIGNIAIDNGEAPAVTPRSQPAGVFHWNEYTGSYEDMVLWKNPLDSWVVLTPASQITYPTRSLEGAPGRKDYKNTGPRIYKRYENGVYTNVDLWPWPYEDLIKQDFGMNETVTEYVRRMVAPEIIIPTTSSTSSSSTSSGSTSSSTTRSSTTSSTSSTTRSPTTTTSSTSSSTTRSPTTTTSSTSSTTRSSTTTTTSTSTRSTSSTSSTSSSTSSSSSTRSTSSTTTSSSTSSSSTSSSSTTSSSSSSDVSTTGIAATTGEENGATTDSEVNSAYSVKSSACVAVAMLLTLIQLNF